MVIVTADEDVPTGSGRYGLTWSRSTVIVARAPAPAERIEA